MQKNRKGNGENMCEKCNSGCSHEFPKITSVFLILTERCSLRCEYCFVKQNPKEMTLDTAIKSLEFIVDNAQDTKDIPSINFFGGEPMLKYKEIIKPLIEYSKEKYGIGNVKFSMTSNGVHFTREILEYFKENNVDILMSLDGCKESHDANRVFHNGKGSFDRIDGIVDDYIELFSPCVLRCTLERNNCHLMMDNVKFALERGFKSIFFVPNSFVDWNDECKAILKDQVRQFGDMFVEYMRNGEVIKLNPFDEKIHQIKRINNTINIPYVVSGKNKCGLGANKFASVGTDGKLYGCQEMTSNCGDNDLFVIGDIYSGADSERRLNLLNSYNTYTVTNDDRCKECKMRYICSGGCVANNYMQTGDMSKQADIMCYWEQLLIAEAIRVTNILGEERNSLFKDTYFSDIGV